MKSLTNYFKLFAATLLTAIVLLSCQKPTIPPTTDTAEALLKAKTWVYDELTVYETGFPPELVYKKGATNNLEDLSRVEYKFLDNGVFQFTNPDGSGGTGSWKLLDNGTKIEVSSPTVSSPDIGEEFRITPETISYKLVDATEYSVHKLIPKP